MIGVVIAAAGFLGLVPVSQAPLRAASEPAVWSAPAGLMSVSFVPGTTHALVGAVAFDRSAGRTRSRVVLVDARSGREGWSAEYRNSNCCGTPAVGFLPSSQKVFASGDELLLAPMMGNASRRVHLDGITLDVAAADGRVLAGVVQWRPSAIEYEAVAVGTDGVLWRARHHKLTAVALSADGLAAAGGTESVAIFDARTGQQLHLVLLPETRLVDLAFAPGALLVAARKTTDGDLEVLGIDARFGQRRWSVTLGPTTVPAVTVAGGTIAVSDFRGCVGAVISLSGVVRDRWTDGQGPVFVAGSPQGEIAVAIGQNVAVRTPSGRVRWRGTIPGTVLGLQLNGAWLAAIGTTDPQSGVPDRVWFVPTTRASAAR